MTGNPIDEMAFAKSFGADFSVSAALLCEDKAAAHSWLKSQSWQNRCAALEILVKFWRLTDSHAEEIFSVALTDCHEEVRAFAVRLLASRFFDFDAWSDQKLKAIQSDESLSARERKIASRGLTLRGHRKFSGTEDELVRDTQKLISSWRSLELEEKASPGSDVGFGNEQD